MTIETLFDNGQAGLTVYSPDCTRSGLWGNIDQAIHGKTGFEPIYRTWFHHDYNSVMRFYAEGDEPPPQVDDVEAAARKYDAVPVSELQYGHLFVKLMFTGPALLTIWQGEDAIAKLLAVKGATHPAKAEAGTIRGSLWCDNAICNLMHSSDDLSEARREVTALGLDDVLGLEPISHPLIDAVEPSSVAHSGVIMLYKLAQRYAIASGAPAVEPVPLLTDSDATTTNQRFTNALKIIAGTEPTSTIGRLVAAYLAGDVVAATALLQPMPATPWERFVVQCGAITRDEWRSDQ